MSKHHTLKKLTVVKLGRATVVLRDTDNLFRFGSLEFILFYPNTEVNGVWMVCFGVEKNIFSGFFGCFLGFGICDLSTC